MSISDDSESDSWDGVEGGVRRYTKSLGNGPGIERLSINIIIHFMNQSLIVFTPLQ